MPIAQQVLCCSTVFAFVTAAPEHRVGSVHNSGGSGTGSRHIRCMKLVLLRLLPARS